MVEKIDEEALTNVLKRMKAALEKERSGETWSQFKDNIICPHCGMVDEHSHIKWRHEGQEEVVVCRNKACKKEYDATCMIDYRFSTKKH